MSLAEALVNIEPRETAGASSSRGFDYQKDWALCKLLELHESGSDYVLLCEHHDDILVLDSGVSPSTVLFFQVKTKKSGYWTLSPLMYRAKGRDGERLSSILGRLFDHSVRFRAWLGKLNLVSNARFRLSRSDGDTRALDEFSTEDLSEDVRKKISSHLEDELDCEIDMGVECRFEVSPLSLEESDIHAKGRVDDFLCRNFGGDRHPTSALYKTLFGEIKRRTSFDGRCDELETLVKRKGISKGKFDEFLECVRSDQRPEEMWLRIEGQLQAEGLPFGRLRALKKEWLQYEVALFNPANESLLNLRLRVDRLCLEAITSNPNASLSELLQIVEDAASGRLGEVEVEHLRAMTLWKLNEEPKVQETDSQPTEEE